MDLFITLIVVGIVVLGFYVWRSRSKKGQDLIKEDMNDTSNELRIDNVKEGGVMRLRNIGTNMEEYDITILARHIYRGGDSEEWYELEGDNGTKKVWISIEEGDGLDVTFTQRQLKLRNLNISREDLDVMSEKAEGELEFEGKTYYFENSSEASFFRNGDTSAENEEFFYYWEFETDEGDSFITIEEWKDGSFDVSLAQPVKASQVEVYSLTKPV